ncbi:hypothetical protein C1645_832740 [Glomus cerebriforme]|uniref:F-box domain-containing protein n=1 Tax=Glomus cerebriforme TaxID=658196 RepID=A0A397SHD0_9GLOM|nr:hypothetical protein C1645_832740 [Glomus cerebriforme]
MYKLNRDVLYLILKEFKNDKKTLYSCLLVNKPWCEIIIPILWKDPWKFLKRGKEKSLFNVIISYLSDKSIRKPLFDYVNYCRHLNLNEINEMIKMIHEESEIKKEIINIFINENSKFTHLYIPHQYDYQLHLIPGVKRCLSDLQFLSCHTSINNNLLNGLLELCKSIKELELFIEKCNNNYGIINLIEIPKNLINIRFLTKQYESIDKPFYKILENSLNKRANNIQYFTIIKQPITNILSTFINLKRLELELGDYFNTTWDCLENLFLPFLQVLIARCIPIKILTSLIKNTNGHLIEINIDRIYHDEMNNKLIIQTIHQNCPYLKYLLLLFRNINIVELDNLLINCQYLEGLYILTNDNIYADNIFDWDYLFDILSKSSPSNLFKFKLDYDEGPTLEQLKLFFDKWRGRNPMLLQTNQYLACWNKLLDFMDYYKAEGIVKKYDLCESNFDDFEWIQENY